MKTPILLFALFCILVLACNRNKPQAKICPELPLTIKTTDTILLTSCSENATSQKWSLPQGGTSSSKSILFSNATPGNYTITLSVSNDYFDHIYTTEGIITVVP